MMFLIDSSFFDTNVKCLGTKVEKFVSCCLTDLLDPNFVAGYVCMVLGFWFQGL